jgi:hypothetical protein
MSRWLQIAAGSSLVDFSTLKMEAIRSSERSVHTKRSIPEDGILQGDTSWPLFFRTTINLDRPMHRFLCTDDYKNEDRLEVTAMTNTT